MLRKLAREATIFALLGMLLAMIGAFVVLDSSARSAASVEAAKAVHGFEPVKLVLDMSKSIPIPAGATSDDGVTFIDVPLRNGTVLRIRECPIPLRVVSSEPLLKPGETLGPPVAAPTHQRDIFDELAEQAKDCREMSDPYGALAAKYGGHLTAITLGDPDQVAIEKDYWTAYRQARQHNLFDNVLPSVLFGLYGFPAGLAIWIFYRLVRFAVKG